MALVLTGPPADEDAWLSVQWTGDAACVDEELLRSQARAWLGDATTEAVSVTLAATPDGADWHVELAIGQPAGALVVRSVRGPDCGTLTRAVALIVSVYADPVAVASTMSLPAEAAPAVVTAPSVEPEPEGAIVAVPPTAVEPPEDAPPFRVEPRTTETDDVRRGASDREAASPRPRLGLGLAVAGELGVAPRGAATFELAMAGVWRHARVESGVMTSVGPPLRLSPESAVAFRFFAGVVRGCGTLPAGAFELTGCGGVEAGLLRGVPTGLARGQSADAVWVAPALGVRPRWVPHPRFALAIMADVVIPVARHRFSTVERGEVHAVAPVAARVGAAAEVRLGGTRR